MLTPDPDEAGLGPKMLALTPLMRRFVLAALQFPTGKDWQIAKAAGCSATSNGYLRRTAHRMFHDERVIAAMREEADKRLRSSALLGVSVLAKIARTEGHKDQLKAAEALLNRVGFHEISEQRVSVEHTDKGGKALVEQVRRLANALGLDEAKLLGGNTIEAEFQVIDGAD